MSEIESEKPNYKPEVVPLTRHVLVEEKIIGETLTAAEIGDKKWLELCLKNPKSINAIGSQGESALHRALANEQYTMAKMLVERGLNANILDGNDRNAIHWLSFSQTPKSKLTKKQSNMINLLIDSGCALAQTDKFGANALHYAAMKGNWPLCELFARRDNKLLLQKDIFEMTPRDRSILWNKRSTARRLRHAESEFNLATSTIEHKKLLELKKKFCNIQKDCLNSLRHDVGFFSDVAFKGFLDEKDLIDGYYSNTLHEDELANGLRQRLRVSGAISDRSVGIETIASQQNKRRKNNPKPENAKTHQSRKPVQFGPVPRSKPRKRYMTEDFSKPMSSKAELPVQIVVDRRGEASLKWQLPDGRIYYDTDLPKLPGEVIQQACGETTVFRMRDGNEVEHFKPAHIDDNQKCRTFTENYSTEVQYHVKHTFS